MHISLVGINHRTAPVNIREKVAISTHQLDDSLSLLRNYISNAVILSTCNRTEIYTIDVDGFDSEEASINFFQRQLNLPRIDLHQHVYMLKNNSAIEHIFRVASGLDSMIIGEFEVLGQVKQALNTAEKIGTLNVPLRNLFQSAIRTGRRIRNETAISQNALSISSVAINLVEGVLGDLTNCKILVIGAGEAGKLVARAARDKGANNIVVISRSEERAAALAATLNGTATNFNNLANELTTSRLVITCAGAPHRILDSNRVERAMKNRPEIPLVIIDIAVPRDVEPNVGQKENVHLFNIDDITQISDLNLNQREEEIEKAENILISEANQFSSWWQSLEVIPVISALMEKAEAIRGKQFNKTLKTLRPLSDDEKYNLEAMTRSIVTKILKDPVNLLKTTGCNNHDYPKIVSELFQLDTEQKL